VNHLATIQTEFLKEARKWDDLTLEEQQEYIKRHPKSKRRITARPKDDDVIVSEQKLTKVQQKLLNSCEPLILHLQDQAASYMDRKLQEFQDEKNKAGKVEFNKLIKSFAGDSDDVRQLIGYTYRPIEESYKLVRYADEYVLDKKRKAQYYDSVKEDIKTYNIAKLSHALSKYITDDFVSVSNVDVSRGAKGFEVSANLKDNQDRNWQFNTRAIGAGGYNIQTWHYRYIINLSSPEVPREMVRQQVSEREKSEKEQRKQQRLSEHQERKKIKKAKKITSVFYEIKGMIKNWDEWYKRVWQDQGRPVEEINTKDKEINRLKTFINKYDFKRKKLFDKTMAGEITILTFDEIKDLLDDVWAYRAAQRI